MKKELSILIPIYNYDCTEMVKDLCRQIELLEPEGVCAKIVMAEDGSDYEEALTANAAMATWPYCHYIRRKQNAGRAAIRNFLAQQSNRQWLLFLDCDMQLPGDDFLRNYLTSEGEEVIDGGFGVKENPSMQGRNLRYTYEMKALPHHSQQQRSLNPYRSFRTTNFMIRRDIMLSHPFDERFLHYGYEDVLFGKELKKNGIGICHINNPMMLVDLESNSVFTAKTEEAMRTLHQFRNDLRGYSHMLTYVDGIHLGIVRWAIRLWHHLFGKLERRNLCGRKPSLKVFGIYKLGYFMTLKDNYQPTKAS